MAVVRLSRDYTCVQGAPVIHSVDTGIFALRYFAKCMACSFCNDQCCSYGVDIDADNAERIVALGDDFAARVRVPRSEWFTDEVTEDPEFPSGRYVRTQSRNGKCVFHSGARGCVIHAYALEKGVDYHTLKPLVSTLFPATFDYGVLAACNEVHDKSLICSGEGQTIYQGTRDELAYYFGQDFVAELDILAAKIQPQAA